MSLVSRWARHQFQGRRDLVLGKHIQKRRLVERNAERRLERVVEHRIACAVGEIGEDDGVFLGQALGLVWRDEVERSRNPRDEHHRGGNHNLPELSPAQDLGDLQPSMTEMEPPPSDAGCWRWRLAEPAEPPSCATATVPELAAANRPVSVSRFSRCNSARMSAALW